MEGHYTYDSIWLRIFVETVYWKRHMLNKLSHNKIKTIRNQKNCIKLVTKLWWRYQELVLIKLCTEIAWFEKNWRKKLFIHLFISIVSWTNWILWLILTWSCSTARCCSFCIFNLLQSSCKLFTEIEIINERSFKLRSYSESWFPSGPRFCCLNCCHSWSLWPASSSCLWRDMARRWSLVSSSTPPSQPPTTDGFEWFWIGCVG